MKLTKPARKYDKNSTINMSLEHCHRRQKEWGERFTWGSKFRILLQ